MTVGERIAQARCKADLSQAALAQAIDRSERSVRRWEAGLTKPCLDDARAVARVLDVSIGWLVGSDDSELRATGTDGR